MNKHSRDSQGASLGVVMPAYNESATIPEIAERVLSQNCVDELVIVDDASEDETWEVIQGLAQKDQRIKVHRHEKNCGKGAALQTGFSLVESPLVIIQDADLEYDPSDYALIVRPILDGRADVVLGSRFSGAGVHRVLYFWHSVGNTLLTTLSNMFTDLNLTDMEVCYKCFRREVLEQITIEESRFGFEPEIVAKVARLGVRIYEVPISYYGRTYEEGKKIGWRDGVAAVKCILKYNLFRRIKGQAD